MTDAQTIRYAEVRASLLAELARRQPSLLARTTDDFAVALVDGWAVLAEILGFHSTRIHEECCLDLATELRSLTELSRLLGYRPDPGVAASAALAFTVDGSVGAWPSVPIPVGTAVNSVPEPGQAPVTFETVETIEGRPAWNALRPRLSRPQPAPTATGAVTVLLAGTPAPLQPGDGLLVPSGDLSTARFGVVSSLSVHPDGPPDPTGPGRPGWTEVHLSLLAAEEPLPTAAGLPLPGLAALPGDPVVGQPLVGLLAAGVTSLSADELATRADQDGFAVADVMAALRAARSAPRGVVVFHAQTAILGSGAPEWFSLPKSLRDDLTTDKLAPTGAPGASSLVHALAKPAATGPAAIMTTTTAYEIEDVLYPDYLLTIGGLSRLVWAEDTLEAYPGGRDGAGNRLVFCDQVVRGVGPGPVVLRDGDGWTVRTASAVRAASKSVFTVSGRATVLTLDQASLAAFGIRGTTVHLGAQWLPLAPEPAVDDLPAGGLALELDDWVDGLHVGQRVAVTGAVAGTPGITATHVTTLTDVRHDLSRDGGTTLGLADGLPRALHRGSVVITANVAAATNGQTRSELLGSGDASDPLPSFTLSGSPLTYLTSPDGSTSTLAVYVDGVRRTEVPALLDPGEPGEPGEHGEPGYVVRHDDQQRSTVQFGSALPTGTVNVRATYRVGTGTAALAAAGQLSLLPQRPPGVRSVTNPLPATGGADPETVQEARRNAPISVRTLGRVVSLSDYEDWALAFPGVAKAAATWTRLAGAHRGVLLTVAGSGGAAIAPGDPIHTALAAGLAARGDPLVPLRLVSYQPRSFRVGGRLWVDRAWIPATITDAAVTALRAAFGFDAGTLGTPVAASQVVTLLQRVAGVVGADLDVCCRLVDGLPEGGVAYRPVLPASTPSAGGPDDSEPPTELLVLEPVPPALEVVPV